MINLMMSFTSIYDGIFLEVNLWRQFTFDCALFQDRSKNESFSAQHL
jgi:hypothetical protein